MRGLLIFAVAGTAAMSFSATRAFPDGAPWGAADPDAAENCTTCHFDGDAVRDSAFLEIDGLPQRPAPGRPYELVVTFSGAGDVVAGFQLLARAGDAPAGYFESPDTNVESYEAAIRSTVPESKQQPVAWIVQWYAPETIVSPIRFYVAALEANEDDSPFGDQVHFRGYVIPGSDQHKAMK